MLIIVLMIASSDSMRLIENEIDQERPEIACSSRPESTGSSLREVRTASATHK